MYGWKRPTWTWLVVLLAPVATSCGGGTAGLAFLFGNGDGGGSGPGTSPTVISDVRLADDGRTSPSTISFRLTDASSDRVDVDVLLEVSGVPEQPLLLAGNPDLTGLASSPAGIEHTFDWDFASQLPSGSSRATGLQIFVRKAGATSGVLSSAFDVGNDPPVVSGVDAPAGEVEGPVAVELRLADSSSDLVDVVVEYCDLADPGTWRFATPLGTDLQRVGTSPGGLDLVYLWDVGADEPQREFAARLRFAPADDWNAGTAVETADLSIDNNGAPVVIVDGSGFFADPDQRRGIPLQYQLLDDEGDALRVVFQWARGSQSFPTLPTDPAGLDAILASPDLRRLHQIATEAPLFHSGSLAPRTSASASLRELASTAAGLSSQSLVGRELELLCVPSPPQPRSGDWPANPLAEPVAALAFEDGDNAFILDRPAPGSWRLRGIDLATGAVVRDVAEGTDGDPTAIAWMPAQGELAVATSVGATWSVFTIDASDGARTPRFTADGSVPAGSVRGLAPRSANGVCVTVADALVAIDWPAGTAMATTIVSGLATPVGIAIDPRRASRLYLAESAWVNPTTSAVDGRILVVDLVTLARRALVSTGLAVPRATAIAIERDSGRLLAITDASTVDGTRELRAVDLGNGGGGPAYQVVGGLPDDATGLATGPDQLRLVALPSQDDLAVGGGMQQVRTIVGFDPLSFEATVDLPFDPAIDARQTWRIRDRSSPLPAGAAIRTDAFVWDSNDLITGGDVVLRAVACDSESGLATDTGVPRAVRAGIDVIPIHLGGAASTTAASALDAADLDGDGDFDLVSTNEGADTATIFFQNVDHQFPSAPNVTLQGIPILAPLQDPVAVRAVDADTDGDLDLVVAGHGSNNLVIARQNAAGTFAVQPLNLGTGIAGPTDVLAADLDGDGQMDVACTNDGSDDIAIFLQLGSGLYSPFPSALLESPNTIDPTGLAAGDLDGDGDLDLVASFRGTSLLGTFLQAAGAFPTAPSQLLGGPGLTDGPEAICLADVDRDGRLDILAANGGGNSVSLFLQRPTGGFVATPDLSLSSSDGPVHPEHVGASDVDGDGALDVIVTSSTDVVVVFVQAAMPGTFLDDPSVVRGAGDVLGPVHAVLEDVDGDGQIDLASANRTGNDLTLFLQRSGRSFSAQTPDLVLGSANDTAGAFAAIASDLDGDGDLDLASANQDAGTVTVFSQIAPASFLSSPSAELGGDADTTGACAIDAADFSADGRVDLITANRVARTLTAFVQRTDGSFPAAADLVLGGGVLIDPIAVRLADLDDDGDLDVVAADFGADRLALFHQSLAGTFPTAPDVLLGGTATTNGPSAVAVADFDGDGRLDLVSANTDGDSLAIFFQQSDGTFHAAPDATLGGPGQTNDPVAVAAADLDGDGDVDVAAANQAGNNVTIFLANSPGSLPAAASLVLTHAFLQGPTSLALEDVDRDGSHDVVCGASTSDRIVVFFQENPAAFSTSIVLGSASYTASPRTLQVVDLDGDGDRDLVAAQPYLDDLTVLFGAR